MAVVVHNSRPTNMIVGVTRKLAWQEASLMGFGWSAGGVLGRLNRSLRDGGETSVWGGGAYAVQAGCCII